MADGEFLEFAARELAHIGMIDRSDVLDGTVVRVRKAYPAYFGEYARFQKVRAYLDRFANLYPIGRNGMHRYNNQDHSMLAANMAVSAITNCGVGKTDIWRVNAEENYHEDLGESPERRATA
jgi:protoporphyrinogen oxidase